MPKPDPALLDPARYPFRCRIEPRFGDLDINMHLNNVALAGILEEGRVRFHRESGYDGALHGMSSMAASLAIDYLGEGHYPAPLEVHAGAVRIGRTSHAMAQLMVQEGRLVAFAQTVLVCVRDGRPVDNPPQFVEAVKPWMLRA